MSNNFFRIFFHFRLSICKKLLKPAIFGAASLFLFGGCYYDVMVSVEEDVTGPVSFENDVKPVFGASCTSCHDGQTAKPDFSGEALYRSLTNGDYITLSEPKSSLLIREIESGHPYPDVLTENDMNLLVRWIQEGAKDN